MKTGLGVPEVMLGLLPGGGGTQRLPKLTGLPNTLDMALTGKTLKAKKAKSVGLVDMVVDALGPGLQPADITTLNYLETVAKQIARDLGNGSMKLPDRKPKTLMKKVETYAMGFTQVKDFVFNKAKGEKKYFKPIEINPELMQEDKFLFSRYSDMKYIFVTHLGQVMKTTSGLYPAPLKILEAVREGVDHGSEKGYAAESKLFGELTVTSESNALIGLFHGQTECKKNKYGKPAKPSQ